MKKNILFYSSVKTKKMFSIQKFYRIDISILKDLGYRVKLSNSILDFFLFWKYDIAFIYFYRYGLLPAFISKLFGKKVIFTGGIDYLDKEYAGLKSYTLQKIFFIFCNVFSDKNILVSNSDVLNVKKIVNNFKKDKFPISYHVINVDDFVCGNIHNRKKIFCTIAWMLRVENVIRKGVDKSILLFKEIYYNDSDFRMVIIGPIGEGTDYLKEIIKKEKLEDVITFTGAIDENEKIDILKESTIYSQLSIYEGFGIAAIEALAAGNLVVHSGKGGLSDAIGNNGILVENYNYKEIAENIKLILNNEEIYKNNIDMGIKHVETNFKYSTRLSKFNEILDSIK